MSYSVRELNPDFGRLNLDRSSGILDDSLSSDGLQKSDGNREREAKKAVSGAEPASEALNPSDGPRDAESPGEAHRRHDTREGTLV